MCHIKNCLFLLTQEVDFISVSILFIRKISSSRYDMLIAGHLVCCSHSIPCQWPHFRAGLELIGILWGSCSITIDSWRCHHMPSAAKHREIRQWTVLPTLRLWGTSPGSGRIKKPLNLKRQREGRGMWAAQFINRHYPRLPHGEEIV